MEKRSLPMSVIVAISALGLLIGLNLILGIISLLGDPTSIVREAITIGLGLLILWGMIRGHRLAWQWGRILGFLAAAMFLVIGVVLFTGAIGASISPGVRLSAFSLIIFQSACLFTIFFAINRPSARRHFDLQCPSCGKFTNNAADFFFNRAKCKACGKVW